MKVSDSSSAGPEDVDVSSITWKRENKNTGNASCSRGTRNTHGIALTRITYKQHAYTVHTPVYIICALAVLYLSHPQQRPRLSPSPAPNCPGSILVAVGVQLHSAPRGGATFPNGAMGFRDFAKHLKKCRKYTSWKKNERNMHHGCHQQCNAMLTFNVWSTNAGRGFFKPIANEKMQVKPNLKYMFFF